MGISDAIRQTGDSGSLIVYHGPSGSSIVGLHRAAICSFDTNSNAGVINVPYSDMCEVADTDYRIFAKWEHVRSHFNIP